MAHMRPYVTVSPYRWKYAASGVAAARRRITSVSVVAVSGSRSAIRLLVASGCGIERRGHGAALAVADVDDVDALADAALAERGAQVVEARQRRVRETNEHVA